MQFRNCLLDVFTRTKHPGGVLAFGAAVLAASVSAAAADMLVVGQAFPDWTLSDDRGADVTSAGLAGRRYLLWFYPKAQTPG